MQASLPLVALLMLSGAIVARFWGGRPKGSGPRLVWGSTPIISYSYWSKAMKDAGFSSETFTTDFYSVINNRADWDQILSEKYTWAFGAYKPFIAFTHSLFCYDIFFLSFDGFFLGHTGLRAIQAQLFKVARKKTVVLAYGGDSYVYKRIRSTSLIHGLILSYPSASKKQASIAKRVDYWCTHGDVVIPGIMGPDGFGRWDILIPSTITLNLIKWAKTERPTIADGTNGTVFIAHAPNHQGFKGTEFIVNAIETLKTEGLKVELLLLEKIQNAEVQRILSTQTDILVEQLICPGHGLNALEGLASGIVTICNLNDDVYIQPLRRWTYFNECPIVSASPENIVETLRKLITRPYLRSQLGNAGRQYVEKYHGLDSSAYLFKNIIDHLLSQNSNQLINLYHPLRGYYPNRSPKIQHPLDKNTIID